MCDYLVKYSEKFDLAKNIKFFHKVGNNLTPLISLYEVTSEIL